MFEEFFDLIPIYLRERVPFVSTSGQSIYDEVYAYPEQSFHVMQRVVFEGQRQSVLGEQESPDSRGKRFNNLDFMEVSIEYCWAGWAGWGLREGKGRLI